MEGIVVDYQLTGPVKIDVGKTVSKWSHLWVLLEWRVDNSWRLVKYVRKDSQNAGLKITIS
jgi:hypothetical protein